MRHDIELIWDKLRISSLETKTTWNEYLESRNNISAYIEELEQENAVLNRVVELMAKKLKGYAMECDECGHRICHIESDKCSRISIHHVISSCRTQAETDLKGEINENNALDN